MLGEEQLKEWTDRALSHSKAETTQVTIYVWESNLTRFATSYIHQNVGEENMLITVKCANEKRIGEASTNKFNKIEEIVERAQAISRVIPANPDFPGFPPLNPIEEIETFIPITYELTPLKRAEICNSIIHKASEFRAFGSFSTDAMEFAIANSNELFRYNRSTSAFLSTTIMGNSGSGYAQAGGRNAKLINQTKVAEKAIEKAKLAQNPMRIEPGRYEIILEPLAVAELLFYLCGLGCNALRYQEGRSPFCGKLGKKVMGSNITIWDDALAPEGCPFPFDFEGVPKKKVSLVENGVVKELVYDSTTAKKVGKESTGHSSGTPSAGAIPLNLFMQGGDSTMEELTSSVKKGILVTRLWYTNLIDPMSLTITGMTRDGTYLLENGSIVQPLKNLRFTQSILTAFSKVVDLSKTVFVPSGEHYGIPFLYGAKVPALRIKDWNFTGVTEH